MPLLSVIIPTYNESENIPILLERLNQCLKDINKEVIVVDDNSPDKTWEIARNLEGQYPWLRVIRRLHDKGLSSAVLTGFDIAEGNYLAVMDADLQHDEQVLTKILQELEKGADIVVGSRKVEGGSVESWSTKRKFISWVATIMAKIALRQGVTDPMSGFFAVRNTIYKQYKEEINPRGFKILLEFLARARSAKLKEVGYTFRGRIHGESKLSTKVIYEYIRALYDLSLGHYIPRHFWIYAAVGFSGLVISFLVLWLALNVLYLTQGQSVILSIEISILTNFILNNYWTFKDSCLKGYVALIRGIITFHAICLAGALINKSIAENHSSIVVKSVGLNIYFSYMIGYIVAAIWNYFINVNITWKVRK